MFTFAILFPGQLLHYLVGLSELLGGVLLEIGQLDWIVPFSAKHYLFAQGQNFLDFQARDRAGYQLLIRLGKLVDFGSVRVAGHFIEMKF